MSIERTIPPTTLTLITTYKCSAACNNCCFECNPDRKEKLPLSLAISHIDYAVSYAGAAYTAVAGVNLGVGLSVVYAAATKTKVSGATHLQISKNFDVYMLSTCENKEITFDNVDLTKVVDDAVEVYKELYVADAKTIDTNRLKQTINLNLSKQPPVSENVLIIERDGKSL